MITLPQDYNQKEIVVDYDKNKTVLDSLIDSKQVQPISNDICNILEVPAKDLADILQVGPIFRFESKNELTYEDTLKIVKTHLHRKADFYALDVDKNVAVLKSFTKDDKLRMVEFTNNSLSIYV
jgi:hypothetical protein